MISAHFSDNLQPAEKVDLRDQVALAILRPMEVRGCYIVRDRFRQQFYHLARLLRYQVEFKRLGRLNDRLLMTRVR